MFENGNVYESLETIDPSVRLLSIQPRSHRDDGEIALILRPFTLKDVSSNYTAISYTWGTDIASHRVWINDKPFFLRNNIQLLLDHFLDPRLGFDIPSLFWVDAICINQSNVHERNSQVALMGDIYKHAEEVLIWLDEASQLNLLPSAIQSTWNTSIKEHRLSSAITKIDADSMFQNWSNGSIEPSLDLQHECLHVFGHRYWTRLWIVQENYLNEDVYLILRDLKIHKDVMYTLFKALDPMRHAWLDDETFRVACPDECPQKSDEIYDNIGSSQSAHWLDAPSSSPDNSMFIGHLLQRFISQDCLEIRDRVYGLLGLCKPPSKIRIDYDCSIVDVTCSVAVSMEFDLQELQRKGVIRNEPCGWPLWLQEVFGLSTDIIQKAFGRTCESTLLLPHWGEQYRTCKVRQSNMDKFRAELKAAPSVEDFVRSDKCRRMVRDDYDDFLAQQHSVGFNGDVDAAISSILQSKKFSSI